MSISLDLGFVLLTLLFDETTLLVAHEDGRVLFIAPSTVQSPDDLIAEPEAKLWETTYAVRIAIIREARKATGGSLRNEAPPSTVFSAFSLPRKRPAPAIEAP